LATTVDAVSDRSWQTLVAGWIVAATAHLAGGAKTLGAERGALVEGGNEEEECEDGQNQRRRWHPIYIYMGNQKQW